MSKLFSLCVASFFLATFCIAVEINAYFTPVENASVRTLSYDYGALGRLGKIEHDSWVYDDQDGVLEHIYSVGEAYKESLVENWSDMREYWVRIEMTPRLPADEIRHAKFRIENGDELRIWCSEGFDEVLSDGGYSEYLRYIATKKGEDVQPSLPDGYTVIYLLVDLVLPPYTDTSPRVIE